MRAKIVFPFLLKQMKSYLEAFLFLSQIHWKNVIYQQNFEISMVLVSTELFFFAHKRTTRPVEGKMESKFLTSQ